jgi:stearoyl-CoA desaturase (delta-9 desaturase)
MAAKKLHLKRGAERIISVIQSAETLPPYSRPTGRLHPIIRWIDADYFPEGADAVREKQDKVDWHRCIPFIFLHAGCLGVFLTGWSWAAVWTAAVLYFVRMFAVTGFYHRYFAHRTFRTSRTGQLLLAIMGNACVQRGPLWWASVHRHHHQHSDEDVDVHSPGVHGFIWSHIGWMTSSRNFPTNYGRVKDLARYPELVFLNRFDMIVPACLAVAMIFFGTMLEHFWPGLHTSGWQMLVWGFFISTVVLLHGTLCINSLAHTFGRRRYDTEDESRNSLILALITLGEGWHNNHHYCMNAARQGFFWWEIDITYYLLKMVSWTGFIWDLHPVPEKAYEEVRSRRGEPTAPASAS